jgi:hypothetical protein
LGQAEKEYSAEDAESSMAHTVVEYASGGPASATVAFFGDPELQARSYATVMVSPHMFGAAGGLAGRLTNPGRASEKLIQSQRELAATVAFLRFTKDIYAAQLRKFADLIP